MKVAKETPNFKIVQLPGWDGPEYGIIEKTTDKRWANTISFDIAKLLVEHLEGNLKK